MFGTQKFVADFLNSLHWTLSLATLNSKLRTPFLLDITYFNIILSPMLSIKNVSFLIGFPSNDW